MPIARSARLPSPTAPIWPLARDAVNSVASALRRRARGVDDLDEARELLAYWERRARRLPFWAILRRREARSMARVWRERVTDAERLCYGRGVLGLASQYATERRMPVEIAHRGRQLVRIAAVGAASLLLAVLLTAAAAIAVIAEAVLGGF